jgi:transcription initiation factor IIE alpha subunit
MEDDRKPEVVADIDQLMSMSQDELQKMMNKFYNSRFIDTKKNWND